MPAQPASGAEGYSHNLVDPPDLSMGKFYLSRARLVAGICYFQLVAGLCYFQMVAANIARHLSNKHICECQAGLMGLTLFS